MSYNIIKIIKIYEFIPYTLSWAMSPISQPCNSISSLMWIMPDTCICVLRLKLNEHDLIIFDCEYE